MLTSTDAWYLTISGCASAPGSSDGSKMLEDLADSGLGPDGRREMLDAAADVQPRRRTVGAGRAKDGAGQAIDDFVLAERVGSEPVEALLRKVVSPPVDLEAGAVVGQARHLQPRVDHPVLRERRRGKRAEIRVPSEQPGMPIPGAERESAAARDVSQLRVQTLGGIQQTLEEASALEDHQPALEGIGLRRRELLGLFLALRLQCLGARRRLLRETCDGVLSIAADNSSIGIRMFMPPPARFPLSIVDSPLPDSRPAPATRQRSRHSRSRTREPKAPATERARRS